MNTIEVKPWRRVDEEESTWGRYEPVPSRRPRPWEESYELIESVPAAPIAGKDVMKFARVMHVNPYLALRERPDRKAPEITRLAFNDRVFVVRELTTPAAWSLVVTDDRKFGYVWNEWLFVDPPEPNARLHRIGPGESAIGIAEQHYKGATGWGHDYRFYVNVLVYTNRGEGDKRKGISKDNKDDSWSATKTKAGVYIWVPSVEFADTLRGKVSSGSITYGAWELVKNLAATVWEWATFGVAFVAGLVHGALECVWDTITGIIDLINLIVDLVKAVLDDPIGKAKQVWESLSLDAIKEAILDWIDDFEKKWNASSSLKRGHFRGWVVGYLIAEVAIAIFTAGAATAVKWSGRLARIVNALRKVKGLGKVIDKADELAKKAKGKLDELLGRDKKQTTTTRQYVNPTHKWMREKLAEYANRAGRTWKTTDDISHTIKRHAHGSPGGSAKKPVQKFPPEWTNDDILEAGYQVANKPGAKPELIGREPSRDYFRGEYKGERVRVQVDRQSQSIVSVAPERPGLDADYEDFDLIEEDPPTTTAPPPPTAPAPTTTPSPTTSGTTGTTTAVQPRTAEVVFIDRKGLVPKGVRNAVMAALQRDLNAMYQTTFGQRLLSQNLGATFVVTHTARKLTLADRASFGALQYPIYFENAHTTDRIFPHDIESIMLDHGIRNAGRGRQQFEAAVKGWESTTVEGLGIQPLQGYHKVGFIKVDLVQKARGDFATIFLNIVKHELGHMFNMIAHTDAVMRDGILLADQSLGYTNIHVAQILGEIARLQRRTEAELQAAYERANP